MRGGALTDEAIPSALRRLLRLQNQPRNDGIILKNKNTMKNFLLSIVLTALASILLQMFLPWWIIAAAAFAVAYFAEQNSFPAFLSGFIAVFLLWIVYAYMLSTANDNILVIKVTELLKPLTKGSTTTLYLITGTIGGLVSGFGALAGSFAGKLK